MAPDGRGRSAPAAAHPRWEPPPGGMPAPAGWPPPAFPAFPASPAPLAFPASPDAAGLAVTRRVASQVGGAVRAGGRHEALSAAVLPLPGEGGRLQRLPGRRVRGGCRLRGLAGCLQGACRGWDRAGTVEGEVGQGAEGLWGQLSARSVTREGGWQTGWELPWPRGVKAQDTDTVWQDRGAGEGAYGCQAAATERAFPLRGRLLV